jgi:predicted RNA-binding Zn-ribbon protein involved in translation (DUF1610 family)
MKSRYTRELLEPLVKESVSIREVLRKLGHTHQSGGMHTHIKRRLAQLGLDTSHFLGRAANTGTRHRGNPQIPANEILVQDRLKGNKEDAQRLRRALLAIGRIYRCAECGQLPIWNGEPLVLQVDHINGENLDNREENLRFLCPNCHSQTSTFGCRNRKASAVFKGKLCVDCQCIISKKATRCKACAGRYREVTKIQWPPLEEIHEMIKQTSVREAARVLGVSDTAVRKRLRSNWNI